MTKVLVLLIVALSASACAPLIIGAIGGAVISNEINRNCWYDEYGVRYCR